MIGGLLHRDYWEVGAFLRRARLQGSLCTLDVVLTTSLNKD